MKHVVLPSRRIGHMLSVMLSSVLLKSVVWIRHQSSYLALLPLVVLFLHHPSLLPCHQIVVHIESRSSLCLPLTLTAHGLFVPRPLLVVPRVQHFGPLLISSLLNSTPNPPPSLPSSSWLHLFFPQNYCQFRSSSLQLVPQQSHESWQSIFVLSFYAFVQNHLSNSSCISYVYVRKINWLNNVVITIFVLTS